MSEGRVYTSTTCVVCGRGRLSVAALAELRPGLCVCSDCTREAVELLVDHYGTPDVFLPAGPHPSRHPPGAA